MTMFSSREPFNDDPKPWLYELSNIGPARKSSSDVHTWFRPRAEYDRPQNNPTNPILTDIRVHYRGDWGAMLRTFEYVTANAAHYVTKDWLRVTDEAQIAHAHRVLTRLASFGGAD